MVEWLRSIGSNNAFGIAVSLIVAGLIGIGALVGLIASWVALIAGLAVVLAAGVHQSWIWRWLGTEQLSTDPVKALKVSLQYEEWEAYQHTAWILMIKVKIRNRTPARQHINGWQLQGVLGAPAPIVPGLAQEIDRRKRDHPEPPSDIPARRSVRGWLFYRLAFAPVAGAPSYELLMIADTGYQYGFRRTLPRPLPIPPAPASGRG